MQVGWDDVKPCQLSGLIVAFLFEFLLDQLIDRDDSLSFRDFYGGKACGVSLKGAAFLIRALMELFFGLQ